MLAQDYLTLRLVRLKQSEEWLCEPQRLTFVFANGGSGKYVAGPVSQRLSPGDVLVANTAEGSKVCVHGGGEVVFWSFSACLENLFPLCASREICLLQSVFDELRKPRFYPASNPMASECHRLLSDVPPRCDLEHRSQLLRITSAILSAQFKQARSQQVACAGVQEHLFQVFENLSSAEILNLSVEELAVKFSCSRRHLSRLFHQYFGFSLATLKMEMRLLKAASLLRDPSAKVINVAEQCGFNHLGLFNTCFKKRFGQSPGHWRKAGEPIDSPSALSNGSAQRLELQSARALPASARPPEAQPVSSRTSSKQKAGVAEIGVNPKDLKKDAQQRLLNIARENRVTSRPPAKLGGSQ